MRKPRKNQKGRLTILYKPYPSHGTVTVIGSFRVRSINNFQELNLSMRIRRQWKQKEQGKLIKEVGEEVKKCLEQHGLTLVSAPKYGSVSRLNRAGR